ncbi:MAG: parallel beta-helix domain-containing protein [Pseudomonadales bacterium]|jgi:parallel beta-helix repeat protein|nr:parallel beta-helix domain-containing protein [Pseudomonadales bacterium]MDP6471038.1 parallel beta-helix domain-containing protein [Pseudomonadales bacterium]MDP6825776.1 parallel beta-helix domain-containing protein [Pseudomonadales bacterium]MDP6970230.1 parallel beta-helix domain-containing protein [Pseudomonadales bacterium]|tara:strand:+ start:4437 stop:5822 length:1386 start_codon:yes stop_codon:yes gene_type:complete
MMGISTGTLLLVALLAVHAVMAGELVVKAGESIQDAVSAAKSGDTILIEPGTYKETVYIDKNNISLRGVVVSGNWPTLEGEKIRNDAVLYSGSGITIENLKIVNYKGNGIMGQAGNNFVIRNNWIIDAGVYGIFPEFGKNGLIEHNVLSGIEDAAIYVGMCDNVDVLHNEVFDSVAGIEIENTRHSIVDGNYVHDNTGGILAFITPGLPIKTNYDVIIRNNFVVNNNHENFAIPGSIVSYVAKGTGITIMAADDVVVENNIITNNEYIGIGIAGLEFIAGVRSDPESEPNPDRVKILNNLMWGNGENALPEVKAAVQAMMPGERYVDIADISKGTGSCILEKDRYVSVGLDRYSTCKMTSTADTLTYTLPEPVEIREIAADEKGKAAYYGICAGCHAYSVKMIGPPTMAIQAMYQGRPEALAAYIAAPSKVREDYPEMPPQNYISEDVRLAVAQFMLQVEK